MCPYFDNYTKKCNLVNQEQWNNLIRSNLTMGFELNDMFNDFCLAPERIVYKDSEVDGGYLNCGVYKLKSGSNYRGK